MRQWEADAMLRARRRDGTRLGEALDLHFRQHDALWAACERLRLLAVILDDAADQFERGEVHAAAVVAQSGRPVHELLFGA